MIVWPIEVSLNLRMKQEDRPCHRQPKNKWDGEQACVEVPAPYGAIVETLADSDIVTSFDISGLRVELGQPEADPSRSFGGDELLWRGVEEFFVVPHTEVIRLALVHRGQRTIGVHAAHRAAWMIGTLNDWLGEFGV